MPMVAASKLIVRIDAMAREYGHDLVATVGKFELFPNSAPVVPGRAELVLEVRSRDDARMTGFFERVKAAAAGIPEVEFRFAPIVAKAPVQCDERLIAALERACRRSGLRWREMASRGYPRRQRLCHENAHRDAVCPQPGRRQSQ